MFTAVSDQLQITLSPKQYLNVIREAETSTAVFAQQDNPVISEYWQKLPAYIVARCPFCSATYQERLDTHSLKYWNINPEKDSHIFSTRGQAIGCRHFVAVQDFCKPEWSLLRRI